ncbi:unnamed protein product [Bursaphelenchus okinawaensis]|uniref:DNA replication ATP-dependent helicase/nuclease n=1 Tax=Bursaphelenchus okinawaensis TaxID=465554 RepID=A0A811K5S4_9BILA|nr:unnamed protein product [Bursaphelenchus okinawaensis]CAG9093216.1 unnamed protein product [Bursaphelenchus okinawaensis]
MDGVKRPLSCVKDVSLSPVKRQKISLPDETLYIRAHLVTQTQDALEVRGLRVDDSTEVTVTMRDIWAHSAIKPGQLFAVFGISNPFTDVLDISIHGGTVVIEPLFLVSPTVLTSVMFCERKAMLSERFRAAGTNQCMLLGCVVHEVFQSALENRMSRPSAEDLQKVAENLVLNNYAVDLVLMDIGIDSFMKDLKPYLENCSNWLKLYAPKPVGFSKPLDKQLSRMSAISGIEDYISDKQLGLKGKIDVSFKIFNKSTVFPLELKTGKSAKSLEHQTQVFLYSLMLKYAANDKVTVPGWILYLKDLQLFKVEPKEQDLAGVLHMRNILASKLADLSLDSFSPIRKDAKFCEGCEQKLNCSLVNKFSSTETCRSEKSREFAKEQVKHLEEPGLEYCKRWIRWNFMEMEEQKRRNEDNYLKKTTSDLDSYTTFSLTMQNVTSLMEDSQTTKKMRDRIIAMEGPKFMPLNHVPLTKIGPFVEDLDECQRDAVVMCLRAEDFAIVQGYPGAGKTTTICAFIKSLIALGKTAIITAHTNSAVDNVLLKVGKDLSESVMRIGSQKSIHPGCKEFTLEYRLNRISSLLDLSTKEKMFMIRRLLMDTPIIFTTCLMASSHSLFSSRRFDYCIVDEASQVVENIALKPLLCSDVFVMVGDVNQLGPLVVSKQAGQEGMSNSLMERLLNYHGFEGEHTSVLSKQYRMNRVICSLSSSLFYNGKLVCANEKVASKCLDVKAQQNDENMSFEVAEKILSSKLEDSVVFVDTYSKSYGDDFSANASVGLRSRFNSGEASYVVQLCDYLVDCGISVDDIGIASPYKGQVDHLQKQLVQKFGMNSPECSTIDRYQGRDKTVMILSLVDGGPEGKTNSPDLLSDFRRLNVALTRAKQKLIFVGSQSSIMDVRILLLLTIPSAILACGGIEPSQDPYDPLGKWHGRHINCGHPAYMYRLPADAQEKIKQIWADYEAGDECDKRNEATMQVVHAIPEEVRFKVFHGMCGPAFLKDVSPAIRTQFQNVWFDDNMSIDEKESEFKKLAYSLLTGAALNKFNEFEAELRERKQQRQQTIDALSPAAKEAYHKWNNMRKQERLYLASLPMDVRAELRLVCTFCGTHKVGKQDHRRARRSVQVDAIDVARSLRRSEAEILGAF